MQFPFALVCIVCSAASWPITQQVLLVYSSFGGAAGLAIETQDGDSVHIHSEQANQINFDYALYNANIHRITRYDSATIPQPDRTIYGLTGGTHYLQIYQNDHQITHWDDSLLLKLTITHTNNSIEIMNFNPRISRANETKAYLHQTVATDPICEVKILNNLSSSELTGISLYSPQVSGYNVFEFNPPNLFTRQLPSFNDYIVNYAYNATAVDGYRGSSHNIAIRRLTLTFDCISHSDGSNLTPDYIVPFSTDGTSDPGSSNPSSGSGGSDSSSGSNGINNTSLFNDSNPAADSDSSDSNDKLSLHIILPLAVGIPLIITIITAVVCYRMRKSRRILQNFQQSSIYIHKVDIVL